MLELTILSSTGWDEEKEEFVEIGEPVTIQLEHSLLAISKWESKWHKCFLGNGVIKVQERTMEETIDYIKCMTITKNVDPEVYTRLSNQNFKDVKAYIDNPMTATYFPKEEGSRGRGSSESKTSELIYYWMVTLNIPFECQKWHINRLLTLIEVCNRKQGKEKKMSHSQIHAQNRALNAQRRARSHSKG